MTSETELGTAIKHPDAAPFYGVDWEDVIGSDQITNSTWSAVTPGVTLQAGPTSGAITSVQVIGGVRHFDYLVKNIITTAGNFIAAGEIRVQVR